MAVIRFSSRAFPEKDRAAVIQDVWAPVTKVDITPADRDSHNVVATVHLLPSLTIGRGRFSSQRAERTRALAALSDNDDIVFCLLTDTPRVTVAQDGEQTVCRPGALFLIANDRPALAWLPSPTNTLLNIAIPRVVLAPAVADLDSMLFTTLPSTAAARLFVAYALSLSNELEHLPAEVAPALCHHVYDLAAVTLGARRDAAQTASKRGVRAARLTAVKEDIAANITHPDISLDWIARRHRISSRYIRDLFQSTGTSFSAFVLERRLAHARRLLSAPRLVDRNISTIALESGFGDLSYFNRVFRRRFGMTPSDARKLPGENPPDRV